MSLAAHNPRTTTAPRGPASWGAPDEPIQRFQRRRTFLRLAALLPAGALLGSLPGARRSQTAETLSGRSRRVRADAVAHGEALKALCARYGFEGLYPLDNALPKQLAEPREQAAWIYRANIGLIERADAVLANLNFFRGAEPDSGTAFEVGYATALGKPVYGYVDDAGSYAERIRRHARSWSARIRPATATAWPWKSSACRST